MFDKLWWRIPYQYRPRQLIYYVKCYLWKRYSTIKPRWLDHGWVDKGDLLTYVAFECLIQFLEKESKYIEWYADERHKTAYTEMLRLKDWWENRFLKSNELTEPLYDKLSDDINNLIPIPGTTLYKIRDKTDEEREIFDQILQINTQIAKELEENLISIIKLKDMMWS